VNVDDEEIIHRIGELADEERHLEEAHSSTAQGLTESEQRRLEGLQVTLDQLWDLLRQRRALRSAGRDPDDAHARPEETVEHYQQ
jgi:dihydroorotase-like cyclic amidohydrolase